MYELTGEIQPIAFTEGGKAIFTIKVNENSKAVKAAKEFAGGVTVSVKVRKKTNDRSLTANAYYWQLLHQLAESLEISSPHCHNLMLRRYGVFADYDGMIAYAVIPDTDETEKKVNESETSHLKPTSEVREGKDGVMYRTYIQLKGSSEMDTKEFSRLVSGLVDECKQFGIETLSPAELARLRYGE